MQHCVHGQASVTITSEMSALPTDLQEMVRARQLSRKAAKAWARLREAFNGDCDELRETLDQAYGR